jgi:pimeloyl-ACP methyl ester carboxylesterase
VSATAPVAPVVVTDAPLAYQYWGRIEDNERVVVLLHGVGGSRESWSDALSGTGSALAEAGFCAVALDLPGYGLSRRVEPYDIGSIAALVLETMWSLRRHCAARIALVGHSMGGMVAQELVATAPQQLDALVLMATSPAFGRADGAWQAEYLAQRLAPLDEGQGMGRLAAGLCKGMASANASHDVVARAAVLMAAVPEATYRSALHAIVRFDRRDALEAIDVPVLCLAGEEDRNAPPPVMQFMAQRIPRAAYRCIAEMGHLAHMEAPQRVNPVLIDFLQTHL